MELPELELWFQDRPKWLQDTARRLVENGSLTDQDFTELLAISTAEAAGQTVTFAGLPAGALGVQDKTQLLHLEHISDVQGINALCPSKPLEFGKTPLCIVYGRNGAGKSGYVRLLKHACGARRAGDLLGNVFLAGDQPQSAKFTFTEDTQTKVSQWTGESIPELQGVEIYDTACGLVYVNEENEVTFEPWLLRLFTQLTNACTSLGQLIQAQIALHVSKKPIFPAEYMATAAAVWYADITDTKSSQEVDRKTAWTPQNEAELTDTNKRLAETNPTAKAATLRQQKASLLKLLKQLRGVFEGLAQECCNAYLQAKADAVDKRKAADEDAKKVFENAPLTGIGSESWRLLWEAGRKYSEEHAYKGVTFPNAAENARCVLCQQPLDQESRERFISFEKFVKGELQRLASDAEESLQKIEDSLLEVPTAEELAVRLQAIGIAEGALGAMVTDFTSALARRRQMCLAAERASDILALPHCDVLTLLESIAADKEAKAGACDEDAKGQNRPELERKAKELSAQKWLHQQRKGIDDEIARLKAVRLLEEAQRLTNTMALSKRKSILAEELITTAYIDRFRDELKRIKDSSLDVELKKTRTDVGRVYHRIKLRDATKDVKTSDILSEGEFRIVSLAAFLADTEGRGTKTPFIFDDPISSLDHVYEEMTAQRLIELTQTRQVVVFTHRLSLVGFLEKYAEKHDVKHTLVCLSPYRIGEIIELPIQLKKTDKAVNYLLNERLAAVKKAFNESDAAYDEIAKGICSDIRILLERIVEKDLINEVVRRVSLEVQTKDKIYALAKITEDDCKFIDDYMTKYSRFEHSQPEEAPIALPKPAELEADLKAIRDFVAKVRQRNKEGKSSG